MEVENRVAWVKPAQLMQLIENLLRIQDPNRAIEIPPYLSFAMSNEDAEECAGDREISDGIFVSSSNEHLREELWNRLCALYGYFYLCDKHGLPVCLFPIKVSKMLTAPLDELLAVSLSARENGTIGR